MGLALCVGYLAEIAYSDEEGARAFREEMDRLNCFLVSAGLQPHREPQECPALSCDMYGYSGLHYLRRIAAHLDLRGVLPAAGDRGAANDLVMEEYYRLATRTKPGFMARLFGRPERPRSFDHLLRHGDAEGYYLPQDFPEVLFPPKELAIPGGMVGSSVRLHEECRRLAAALQLPVDLDPEAQEVWDAVESQGQGEVHWKRCGIEAYLCLRVIRAADHSLKHGAVIVFC